MKLLLIGFLMLGSISAFAFSLTDDGENKFPLPCETYKLGTREDSLGHFCPFGYPYTVKMYTLKDGRLEFQIVSDNEADCYKTLLSAEKTLARLQKLGICKTPAP